ncbi:hypothetical protein AB0M31_12240 [Streptomyces sp. NPDC051773]
MPSAPYEVDGTSMRPGPTRRFPHIEVVSEAAPPRLLDLRPEPPVAPQ